MSKTLTIPVALTIAGSDSGGGAGIQADLKTFAALGVHGTTAITCITAQNPRRISGIQACRPLMVREQIEAVFAELPPMAVKTGMLYSTEIIRVVAKFFQRSPRVMLVVDPVMIATSGKALLKPAAMKALRNELLPLATLITPNLDEAAHLLGRPLRSEQDLQTAARELQREFHCAVLVKGGHLKGVSEAVDIFYDGKNELRLSAPFIKGIRTHGTGCTYSAAITAYLALGRNLPDAVTRGKKHVTQAIASSQTAGGHTVLNNCSR